MLSKLGLVLPMLIANQNDESSSSSVNECRVELEKSREKFDVIVGDLADPVEGGPCYQLYTKSFYEQILKPKLNDRGIFVTQVL